MRTFWSRLNSLNIESRRWSKFLEVLIFLNLLIPLFFLRTPIVMGMEGDALDYRMPLINWALAHHAYPNFPWTMVDDYPALGEILMAICRSFVSWGPRIVAVGGYALFVLGAVRLGKMLLPRNWALLAVIFVATVRAVTMQDNLVMVDGLAAAFTVWSSVYLVQEWRSTGLEIRNFVLAGIFAGLALATRYTQGPTIIVLGAFVLLDALTKKRRLGEVCRACLSFGLPVIVILSPWLIRNMLINQNPIFPLAYPLLGGKNLDLNRYHEFLRDVSHYGFGTSLKEFLLLPYRFAFFKTAFDYAMGPLFLALLPWMGLSVVLSCLSWRSKWREIAPVALFFLMTLAWFVTAKQTRFLIQAVPFGIFAGFLGISDWFRRTRQPRTHAFVFLVLAAMATLQTVKHVFKHKPEFHPDQLVLNQKDIPEWLNAHARDGKVLLLERTGNLSAIREDFVFAYPHPYSTSLFDYRRYRDPARYYTDLYSEGVRYVYVMGESSTDQLPKLGDGEWPLVPLYHGKTGGEVYALRQT